MRTGIIAKKIGMTQCYTDEGIHVPVTVLKLESVQVVACRTVKKDGYDAVVLGAGGKKPKRVGKALQGFFKKNQILPKAKLAEFRVSSDNLLNIGDELLADHFVCGQYVDVTATSIGKGFAGAMKRHNFRGLRATHGVSISHRSHGSTGHSQDPGKVFKGKKMAGHMGARRVQVQNLQVFQSDNEKGLLLIRGGVPGASNGWVLVRDAYKKTLPEAAKFPASVRTLAKETVKESSNDNGDDAPIMSDTEAPEAAIQDNPAPPTETAKE